MTASSDREIRKFGRRLAEVERQLVAQNVPQLGNSSIERGALVAYDDDGQEAARFGQQPDGSFGSVVLAGPDPATPTAPTITTKNVGAVGITWDGAYADGSPALADFSRVEVHITEAADTPLDHGVSSATRFGAIETAAGGLATIKLDGGSYFIRLVTRSLSAKFSAPSDVVTVEVKSVLDRDDVIDVIEQAGTGNRIYYATVAAPANPDPDAASRRDGDMWRQRQSGGNGDIVAEWRWESGLWVAQQLSGAIVSNLDAGKITAGTIQAAVGIGTSGSVTAGDPLGAMSGLFGNGTIGTYAVNEDGVQYAGTLLGSVDGSDALQIGATPGAPPTFTVSPAGRVGVQGVHSASDVEVAGVPIVGQILDSGGRLGYMDLMPRGIVRMASMGMTAVGTWPNNVNSPIGWFTFSAHAGRVYRFEMPIDGTLTAVGSPSSVRMTARVYQTVAPAAGIPAAEPTLTAGNLMTEWSQYQPAVNSAVSDTLAFNWQPWTSSSIEPNPREVSLLVTVFPNFGTFTATTSRQSTWVGTVTDVGPADSSKMVVASASGAASQRRYVTTWVASQSRAWGQDGVKATSAADEYMRQGSHPNPSVWYGQAHSAFVCNSVAEAGYDNEATGEIGKTMATALTGAQISQVEVEVYATSWRGKTDNRVYLQPWTGAVSSLPTTHTSTPNLSNRWIFSYNGPGEGKWMTVPSSWVSATVRGVQIGPLDGLAASVLGTSGNFAGAAIDGVGRRPKIRVTYTR